MNTFGETSWCPLAEQALNNSLPVTTSNTGFATDYLDYNLSPSDFDGALEFYTDTSQPQQLTFLPSFPSSSPTPTKSRVSLACIPCRNRHSKCDATTPVCKQCRESNRSCLYTASRRSRGQAAQIGQPEQHGVESDQSSESERPRKRLNQSSGPGSDSSLSISIGESMATSISSLVGPSPSRQTSDSLSTPIAEPDRSSEFLDLYYEFFHHAHPFVLPRRHLNQRLQTNRASLDQLLPILEFIGSLFASSAASGELRTRAENTLLPEGLPETGFTVQALLIFAIATHSCTQFVHAREILDRAIRIAVQIGIQHNSFSIENGEGCLVTEESWRRTWWYLYVTDGSFAGIRRSPSFLLRDIHSDADLPCEEADYRSGKIPKSRTQEEYSSREFAGEEVAFSSFTYLIDLTKIIGLILALSMDPSNPFDPEVVGADTALVNWTLYLPKHKHLITEDSGKVDEILFQAHMLFSTLTVYLHRPRSQLAYCPVENTSKCAPPPSEISLEDQQRAYDFHTTKTLEAAGAGIGLFTLPTPFVYHSPLIICGLTLCILANISACRFKLTGSAYTAARDRVRLGMGAIKALGRVWTVGAVTVKELQVIARETLLNNGAAPIEQVT